jgi:solute carrier family 25 (peroxisomal adenine nucleotide transporter), member 17
MAGVATAVATNPIWVLNTRMSTIKAHTAESRQSSLAVLLALVAEEGPLALFKGVVPGLILVTNPAIQYMVFERLRAWTERRRGTRGSAGKLTDLDFFWLGLLSKFVASTITYPLILVKSKVRDPLCPPPPPQPPSRWQCSPYGRD